ncbi:dipeptide epimerase [Methyloceanibacter methanicus]|uniref:Dipeptide epimerase n=1 Tax=Methyloceanibacter methanicus TaxID=1774968 RepID=A0A1E3VZ68_9HYPH|nr:N-acetyl-D-Glu racemase DgcA [Methyloceanibacter methanicus]ODR98803.1 dipeptide epimerase [Methyloceanibacter methanicus]
MACERAESIGGGQPLTLSVSVEHWPIRGHFTIARGSKTQAAVVLVEIGDGTWSGRGECVPYARYGESVEGVVAAIEILRPSLAQGLDRTRLERVLPAGAARNAVDCALWDLAAKQAGCTAAELAGLAPLKAVPTAYTISLGAPEIMAAQAKDASAHPLLKLKLGGADDAIRMRAVRQAVPDARLIVDANEAWRPDEAAHLLAVAAETGIELVEQPLPAGEDRALAQLVHDVPICADESAHDTASLDEIAGLYDAVNIKLDKTGGLTEALRMVDASRARGLKIMVGSMVATSLAMAPAILVAQTADWVDLDGPLLLARDRDDPLAYGEGKVYPPSPALWG